MIKRETTTIKILNKEYEYFRSAQSEKLFAKKAAEIAKKEPEDLDESEWIEYSANLVRQGILDAMIGSSFIYKLFNRPPSVSFLMRTMTSNDLAGVISGAHVDKKEESPN